MLAWLKQQNGEIAEPGEPEGIPNPAAVLQAARKLGSSNAVISRVIVRYPRSYSGSKPALWWIERFRIEQEDEDDGATGHAKKKPVPASVDIDSLRRDFENDVVDMAAAANRYLRRALVAASLIDCPGDRTLVDRRQLQACRDALTLAYDHVRIVRTRSRGVSNKLETLEGEGERDGRT